MKQTNNSDKENLITFKQIEIFIQQNENVCIPAIIFEYCTSELISFDEFDLYNFFEKFGEIEEFQLKHKTAIVLFQSFFSANTCREFLKNEHNFKENKNNKINVKWFNFHEDNNLLSDSLKEKFYNIFMKNSINLKTNIFNLTKNNNNVNNDVNQNFIQMQYPFNTQIQNNYNINIVQNLYIPQNSYYNNNVPFQDVNNCNYNNYYFNNNNIIKKRKVNNNKKKNKMKNTNSQLNENIINNYNSYINKF